MKTVRVGVIGCGEVAEYQHFPLIQGDRRREEEQERPVSKGIVETGRRLARRLLVKDRPNPETPAKRIEGAEIIAVSDINERRVSAARKNFGIPHSYADYRELLARGDIDAVLICTPPSFHPEIAIEAARHGKHIFCEKPLAMTSELCSRMIQAADEAEVVLQVGYVLRFSEERRRIREAILNDEIGRPIFWREVYNAWAGGPSWNVDHESGGGPLWENSHSLDFLRSIFGEPEVVFGMGGRCKPDKTSAADTIAVSLIFPAGDKALFTDSYGLSGFGWDEWLGKTCRRNFLQIDVLGPKGFIQFPDADLSQTLTICTYGNPEHRFEKIPWSTPTGGEGYQNELEHFFDCVREGKPSLMPGEEGLRTIQLVETVYHSMRTGEVCKFGPLA
ncbi:MAG TPA: Gfo/Idh/MocA family oxidoreductase [Candidatus Udaeobacter sp.]|nr:Gfo/Idh/MocA family oxidoreductase [Candidatus Udaeobacter sp.]